VRSLHLIEVGVRWPPETFLCWKLEGLAARGLRVTVASKSVYDSDARVPGVELVAIPPRGTGGGAAVRVVAREGLALLATAPWRLVRLLRSMRRHVTPLHRRRHGSTLRLLAMYLPLARMRPDVVHFEWHASASDYLPLREVWRCPIVTSCHGSEVTVYPHVPGHEEYAARIPEVMRAASAVHCVADALRREAIELGLDEPAKARVIRQGVDLERFRPPPRGRTRDEGAFRLVTVGWLVWVKGYEYALEALRELIQRGVPAQLDILGGFPNPDAGEESERARILHTVADLGLEDRVRLRGTVTTPDVIRALQEADAMVHASVTEGLPTVLLEAMACGLPVVATDCGGVTEAVSDGVEGFVVAPRAPGELADALETLWRDPALRARMGVAGRGTVVSAFTLERQVDEFLDLYREVARR
jgi:glycosyltransferase involved in cell wall biosynthesis